MEEGGGFVVVVRGIFMGRGDGGVVSVIVNVWSEDGRVGWVVFGFDRE